MKVIMKQDLTINYLSIILVVKTLSVKYSFKHEWTIDGVVFANTDNGVEQA